MWSIKHFYQQKSQQGSGFQGFFRSWFTNSVSKQKGRKITRFHRETSCLVTCCDLAHFDWKTLLQWKAARFIHKPGNDTTVRDVGFRTTEGRMSVRRFRCRHSSKPREVSPSCRHLCLTECISFHSAISKDVVSPKTAEPNSIRHQYFKGCVQLNQRL